MITLKAQTLGARFEGAEYDARTEFPESFDPRKKECAFVRWLPNNKSPTRARFCGELPQIARPEIERNSSHHDSNQLWDYPCGLTSP
jgi:hypothetical protein